MKRTSRLVLIAILAMHSMANVRLTAQFQMQWMVNFMYVNGEIVTAVPDNSGGVFIASQSFDSVCYYDLGQIVHLNGNGGTSWTSSLYYETPCMVQELQSLHVFDKHLYYSVQDTTGWLIKSDTSANEIHRIDTGYTWIAADVDPNERITTYVPQWSEVFCFDSAMNQLWSVSLPYSFTMNIHGISSDNDLDKIVAFDYQDPTQSDPFGVGLARIDSQGQFVWGTLINQQLPVDEDLYVDFAIDELNNIYVLSKDLSALGGFITKVNSAGNVVARSEFTPTPVFTPFQIELDTIHGLVYVAGRTSNSLIVLKYDDQLNPIDTSYYDRVVPDINAVAVNEWGYFFHLWMSDSSGSYNLRLEMYNHLGQMVDVYTYFDTTLFYVIRPHSICFDDLGNVFVVCEGLDPNFDDVGLIIKLNNPLNVLDTLHVNNPIVVYPNPASHSFQVAVSIDQTMVQCNLYSSEGKRINTYVMTDQANSVNIENLSNGFYFLEFVLASGERLTNKLIIQH